MDDFNVVIRVVLIAVIVLGILYVTPIPDRSKTNRCNYKGCPNCHRQDDLN